MQIFLLPQIHKKKKEEGYGCNTKPNSPKPVWLHTQNLFYIQNINIEHTAWALDIVPSCLGLSAS